LVDSVEKLKILVCINWYHYFVYLINLLITNHTKRMLVPSSVKHVVSWPYM